MILKALNKSESEYKDETYSMESLYQTALELSFL